VPRPIYFDKLPTTAEIPIANKLPDIPSESKRPITRAKYNLTRRFTVVDQCSKVEALRFHTYQKLDHRTQAQMSDPETPIAASENRNPTAPEWWIRKEIKN